MSKYASIDPLLDEDREIKFTAPIYRVLGYDGPVVEINPLWGDINDDEIIRKNQYIFGKYLMNVIGVEPAEAVSASGLPDARKGILLYCPTYDKLGRLVGYDYAVQRMNNGYVRLSQLLELDHDKDGEEVFIYKADWYVAPDLWDKLNKINELPF